jgi:hypothetical protein
MVIVRYKTSTICGRKDCENPGLIWLDEGEAREYERGERVFEIFNTNAVKVRVE